MRYKLSCFSARPFRPPAVVLLAVVSMLMPVLNADSVKGNPGGAPPRGSGPIHFTGFPSVIEGDSLDLQLYGNRVAVGIIGVDAPRGNSSCGKAASKVTRQLLGSDLYLQEDLNFTFDSRKRRMYYVYTKDGRSVARELARNGLAHANGKGKEAQGLSDTEKDAAAKRVGCITIPSLQAGDPNSVAFPVSTDSSTSSTAEQGQKSPGSRN